jgi:hypothetical protein
MQGKLLFHHMPSLVLGFVCGVVIIPELGLPACSGSFLAYLEVEVLASLSVTGAGAESRARNTNCFLDLLCHLFGLSFCFRYPVIILCFSISPSVCLIQRLFCMKSLLCYPNSCGLMEKVSTPCHLASFPYLFSIDA